ncbi:hypothetical protein BJ912DRAFT_1067870 [Pholiota molesta]|nr:hypothetical protein BJ912DRAFT_1067870 [Pholiota molesta]
MDPLPPRARCRPLSPSCQAAASKSHSPACSWPSSLGFLAPSTSATSTEGGPSSVLTAAIDERRRGLTTVAVTANLMLRGAVVEDSQGLTDTIKGSGPPAVTVLSSCREQEQLPIIKLARSRRRRLSSPAI